MHFVYIVQCSDKSFYTGVTSDIKRRVWQHNKSKYGAKSLRGKRPVHLVHSEKHISRSKALKREKEIKGWRRENKIKLINSSLH